MTAESTGSLLRDILVYESRLSVIIENERKHSQQEIREAEENASLMISKAIDDAAEHRRRIIAEAGRQSLLTGERIAEDCNLRIEAMRRIFSECSSELARAAVGRILHHAG